MKYNCIIIGSGPAGFYSALSCAKEGFKTAIIEKTQLGGTGFRSGCLPVKRNLDVIRKIEEALSLSVNGITLNPDFKKNLLTDTETYMIEVEDLISKRLKEASVDIFRGDGQFLNTNAFQINDKKLETDFFIIATGTSPGSLPGIALDKHLVLSHMEAVKLKTLPKEIVIIGGNVEGIELASLFSSLGVKVTVIEQVDQILNETDRDLIQPVIDDLVSKNTTFLTSIKVQSIETDKNKVIIRLLNKGSIITEKVILTGVRKMNIPEGIELTGINYSDTGIHVNNNLQTNIPNIFAVGDINGIHGMAHIAIQQGMLITKGIKGQKVINDYSSLPRAMFTLPEIAGAGKQEWELIKMGKIYKVKSFPLKNSWRGFSKNINTGFIKLIFEHDILTGIWMTGQDASEILSSSGLLIGQNLRKTTIMNNLFIHPTLGEGILETLFSA
ncbi:MAG: NAD(P)/FAD-dependent oxidoreductase [Spirochaetota bacterium]|nr:NAD(P)/FAD-dependent oxidoreductase [Spirochaetota bacterium]